MTVATTVWADIDEAQFHAFVEGFFGDLGAVMHAATVLVGDRLGLYRAMDDSDWHTPEQIAETTGTHTRYVHEWLAAQAASGFAEYDPATGRFRLTPVQALALTGRHGIFDAPAGLLAAASVIADVDLLCDAFTTGRGLAWSDRHPDLTEATLRFFRGNYATHLVPDWLPALDGVEEHLRQGIRVADIGCGGGASTILMAQAYPASQFIGFDSHGGSIDLARQAAAEAGVAHRCRFETATAKDYTGSRPGHGLRRPARHGGPDGRRRPRPRHARGRRHLDDRRALRPRPAREQPHPYRSHLLLRVHNPVPAHVTLPRGRRRPWRPSRRGPHPRGRHRRGLHPLPPGSRNRGEPHLRSTPVTRTAPSGIDRQTRQDPGRPHDRQSSGIKKRRGSPARDSRPLLAAPANQLPPISCAP